MYSMNKNILISTATAILFVLSCLSSCQEQDDGIVTAITIMEADYIQSGNHMQISLKDNTTLQLTPFIMPQNAINKKVKYSNMYSNLMEVSESGLITPKAVGTDTLTVSATDGSGITVSYRVVITDHKIKATGINVTADGSNIALKMGGAAFNLGACVTLSPVDTWDKTVTYKSNDETIVSVTGDGIVTPVGVGSTTITITTADGSNISRNVNVVVQDVVQRWEDLKRDNWTVITEQGNGFAHLVDGSTGFPEHMFTSDNNQFLALFKPGGNNAGQPAPPAGFKPYFVVDIKTAQPYNYFRWHHRGNNHNLRLKAHAVHLYGSTNGETFTQIMPEEPEAPLHPALFWIPTEGGYVGNPARPGEYYYIDMPESNYRYLKVEIVCWSNNYGLGDGMYQHPDWPGNGDHAYGNAIQIAQFGLGRMFWE